MSTSLCHTNLNESSKVISNFDFSFEYDDFCQCFLLPKHVLGFGNRLIRNFPATEFVQWGWSKSIKYYKFKLNIRLVLRISLLIFHQFVLNVWFQNISHIPRSSQRPQSTSNRAVLLSHDIARPLGKAVATLATFGWMRWVTELRFNLDLEQVELWDCGSP